MGPQDVAHLDAKRVLELLAHTNVRVLGGVENMAGLTCPHCGEVVEVFAPVREERSLWALGVRKLAALPLDPALGADGGRPLLVAAPDSVHAHRFRELARAVRDELASAP